MLRRGLLIEQQSLFVCLTLLLLVVVQQHGGNVAGLSSPRAHRPFRPSTTPPPTSSSFLPSHKNSFGLCTATKRSRPSSFSLHQNPPNSHGEDVDVDREIVVNGSRRNMTTQKSNKTHRFYRQGKFVLKKMLRTKRRKHNHNNEYSLSSFAVDGEQDDEDHLRDDHEEEEEPVGPVIRNVHQLRKAVLQDKIPLQKVVFYSNFSTGEANSNAVKRINATDATTEQLNHHPVLQLLAQRRARQLQLANATGTSNHRKNKHGKPVKQKEMEDNSNNAYEQEGDPFHLALAIEGGGMRGAVSAGMAAAIASLGLTDAFDSIYGSSAGSVVGAYMVSRQMCVGTYFGYCCF